MIDVKHLTGPANLTGLTAMLTVLPRPTPEERGPGRLSAPTSFES